MGHPQKIKMYIDGYEQDCAISTANALEIPPSVPSPQYNKTRSWRIQRNHNQGPIQYYIFYIYYIISFRWVATKRSKSKWKHFPRYWPFVWGIHRSSVNSPHKGQGRGALMFSLMCAWINSWVNNCEAGDLRCHHAHYDITVKFFLFFFGNSPSNLSMKKFAS